MANSFEQYLEAAGFNLVKIPKADIKPLELLAKERGKLERVGNIDHLFKEGDYAKPEIKYDIEIPDELRGGKENQVKSKTSLNFIGNFLSLIGIKNASASASFDKNQELNYELIDPEIDEVLKASVDTYLNQATIKNQAITYVEKLYNSEIYVITQVLKCNSILISSAGKSTFETSVDIPEIKELVSANVDLVRKSEKSFEIKHSSEQKLVFAVQAARIWYKKKDNSFRLRTSVGQTVRHDGFATFLDTNDLLDI